MTRLVSICFGVMLAFSAAACKKGEEKAGDKAAEGKPAEGQAGGDKAGAGEAADKPADTPAAVEVSPEMQDFLAGFGSSDKVDASLKKHGAEGLATQDMEMYDLTDPKVTAHEKRGAQDCYTFDAKAGVTTRTYVVCWEGGKIATVEDKGMR